MRTDDQRDVCIDVLLERVKALEAEVRSLKGKPYAARASIVKQDKHAGPAVSQPPAYADTKKKRASDSSSDVSLESAIGTRWIGRVGVVAVLFGLAFFLKYSFDNRLIGETGRIMLGIFWGAAFVAGGEYLQKKRNMGLYGQMLSGGGLGVLYLSLYAAFALYHLIPAVLAAVGMIAVTTTGMALSIRYSTFSLAAIALLGGFLTPIMLSTGQNQPVTLFSYVLLLDVATLVLLRLRRWPLLVIASLLGTVVLYVGWHLRFFDEAQRWLAFGTVVAFFVFYNACVLLLSRGSHENRESELEPAVIFASAAFLFTAVFAQYGWKTVWPMKIFTLAFAGVEIGLADLMRRRLPPRSLEPVSYAAVSVILSVAAGFISLEQRWLMPVLAAEMTALGWMGLRLRSAWLKGSSYLLGLVVLCLFARNTVLYLEPFDRYILILNDRFLSCVTVIAALYCFMVFISRYQDRLDTNENQLGIIIFIIVQALSLILLSAEIVDFFRFRAPGHALGLGPSRYGYKLSLSVLWALYASLLVCIGILKRFRGARLVGIVVLGVAVIKVFFIDLSELQTPYRIIAFIVLGLLLLAVSYGYNRFRHLIFGEDQS